MIDNAEVHLYIKCYAIITIYQERINKKNAEFWLDYLHKLFSFFICKLISLFSVR